MLTKDNNLRVMEVFFKNPSRSFHLRELSRMTGLSTTGIIKIVKKLKKEGLLNSKKEKVVEEVTPTFNEKFYLIKKLYNIYSLYETGVIKRLKEFYEEPEAIILFGSYSKGLDAEKSDIDICVLSNKKEQPNLAIYEKYLNRKINVIPTIMSDATKEFKNSLVNGNVIEGYMELAK